MKIKLFFILLLSVLCFYSVSAQKNSKKKITITGLVLDSAKRPVENAIIMIDNKKTKAVTDNNGNYKIKVKPDAVKIGIFSLSNGITEEPINGRTRINLNLGYLASQPQSDSKDGTGEEQISVGYGSVKKKNLTTQVGKIDGTDKKYASYSTIYDMIRGQVAGVQVSGKTIRIQGTNSFSLNNEPLIIVDGSSVRSLDNITPQMVKSIEVLKGPSASIYGSRGANGVIIIYTKRGKD
jgi:TonB-dependent SusC/RagA subfamily outer membrane receptor